MRLINGTINKTAIVVGCGGLGCYVVELLARAKVQRIIVYDNDKFTESNMNRQLYSSYDALGKYKVDIAKERVQKISKTQLIAFKERINKKNIEKLITEGDVVVDCTDNIKTRLLLQEFCKDHDLTLVSGALNDFYGHVTTILPGDDTLNKLYKTKNNVKSFTISYVPSVIASVQASEAVKVMMGDKDILRNKVFFMNLEINTFFVQDI